MWGARQRLWAVGWELLRVRNPAAGYAGKWISPAEQPPAYWPTSVNVNFPVPNVGLPFSSNIDSGIGGNGL